MNRRDILTRYKQATVSFREAKDKLRVVYGVTLSRRDGEYRVSLKGKSKATAYYTDYLSDAFATESRHSLCRIQCKV
jgi:hypothetical protein